jgi:hypothetical protein
VSDTALALKSSLPKGTKKISEKSFATSGETGRVKTLFWSVDCEGVRNVVNGITARMKANIIALSCFSIPKMIPKEISAIFPFNVFGGRTKH